MTYLCDTPTDDTATVTVQQQQQQQNKSYLHGTFFMQGILLSTSHALTQLIIIVTQEVGDIIIIIIPLV